MTIFLYDVSQHKFCELEENRIVQFIGTRVGLPGGVRPNLFLGNWVGIWVVEKSVAPQSSHRHLSSGYHVSVSGV